MIKTDKLLGNKKLNSVIYILIALGVMLITFGNLIKSEPERPQTEVSFSRAREAELILSEIKGAGEVRVMISGEENGENSVLYREEETQPHGSSVLIVADGGADSRVREKIVKAATAALGVDPHKIVVFERKD